MESYQSINVNEKNGYISFMSPVLRNKKGHKRQMTKSIKNIKSEELNRILKDTDELLSNYDEYSNDYESFIKAYDKFDKKAILWVFEKTDIIDKYNQESVMRTIEKKIPIKAEDDKFIYPTTLLIGASGSGKTTFIKQLIGSVNTDFPATMQSNTTLGSMYAVIENNSSELIASVKLINRSALQDRLEIAYIKILKEVLMQGENLTNEGIVDILYDNITIFDDKKVKLQYIVSKNDITNDELIYLIKQESQALWSDFLKNSSDLDISIFNVFSDNISADFYNVFDLFADDNISESKVIDSILSIIENKIVNIIRWMYDSMTDNNDIKFSFNIMDEFKSIDLCGNGEFSFPKMLTVTLSYMQQRNPDNELRQKFFKILESISSANEINQGKTLFPLVEHIRIKGNFKPLWSNESNMHDYILIDSEGIGHDITNQNVSMQLRSIMSKCNAITVIQNASEQMQTAFASILKSLIYNGWISKTNFCFNRMEMFDQKAHSSVESKVSFVKSNIKNALKKIISEEMNSDNKIVSGREHIFEKSIKNNSYYLEYIKERLTNSESFIPEEKQAAWSVIKSSGIDDATKAIIRETFVTNFTDEFNPVNKISEYLKSITCLRKKLYTKQDIALKAISPQYRADKFSAILNLINNSFVKEFLSEISSSPWQTVKAFNIRIASNWDQREWRTLQPEAMFIQSANSKIMSYLLNPENIEEINERCGFEFTMIIQQIISEEISDFITQIAKRTIYFELLHDCWKPAADYKNTGSTCKRESLIKEKVCNKFIVDSENGKYNFLYNEFVNLVFENPYNKALSCIYK